MLATRVLALGLTGLLLGGCAGPAGSPAPTPEPIAPTLAPSAPPPATEAPAAPVPTSAPAASSAPKAVLIAVAGADRHGKTTLLAALSQVLGGRARSTGPKGGPAEVTFDAGTTPVTLKEYASHDALLAALGQRGLSGFLLVVEQPEAIMKQTREQIAAAGRAHVRPWAVAQTKDDLVDDTELKDLEQGEIEDAFVQAGLLAAKDAGTWEAGRFKPGTRLPFFRVSAKRALAGDAQARAVIARLAQAIEKRAAP